MDVGDVIPWHKEFKMKTSLGREKIKLDLDIFSLGCLWNIQEELCSKQLDTWTWNSGKRSTIDINLRVITTRCWLKTSERIKEEWESPWGNLTPRILGGWRESSWRGFGCHHQKGWEKNKGGDEYHQSHGKRAASRRKTRYSTATQERGDRKNAEPHLPCLPSTTNLCGPPIPPVFLPR